MQREITFDHLAQARDWLFRYLPRFVIATSLVLNITPVVAQTTAHSPSEDGWPRICRQTELVNAVRMVFNQSTRLDSFRHPARLDVDKATLMALLRAPDLNPLHLFFPPDKVELGDVLYWDEYKRAQLEALRFVDYQNAMVFVIAQTGSGHSPDSDQDATVSKLATARLANVVHYLGSKLPFASYHLRGAEVTLDAFTLSETDARRLGIEPAEFNNDTTNLNRAVHLFVFPCAPLLPTSGAPPSDKVDNTQNTGSDPAEHGTASNDVTHVEKELTNGAAMQLITSSTKLQETARMLKCDDSGCQATLVREALAAAHKDVMRTLENGRYSALADYADEILTRQEASVPNGPTYFSAKDTQGFLAGMAAIIERLTSPRSHSLTLIVRFRPTAFEFKIWPMRYVDGGKPVIPSGATITLNRGKYRYQFDDPSQDDAKKRIAFEGEISLIDALGSELVCGGIEMFAACAVK